MTLMEMVYWILRCSVLTSTQQTHNTFQELEALFFKEASELHNGFAIFKFIFEHGLNVLSFRTDDPMIVREEMARMREFTLKKADQNGVIFSNSNLYTLTDKLYFSIG